MINTWQADSAALVCYSIVQEQVTSVHLDTDSKAIQDENARFADGGVSAVGCAKLPLERTSYGGQGLSAALTAGRPVICLNNYKSWTYELLAFCQLSFDDSFGALEIVPSDQ